MARAIDSDMQRFKQIVRGRVRENLKKHKKESFEQILNRSINETLPRSVLTHGTTLSSLLALTIFASAVLGLATALNSALETGVGLNRENAIRMGLRSFIEETRRKEIADMTTQAADERRRLRPCQP